MDKLAIWRYDFCFYFRLEQIDITQIPRVQTFVVELVNLDVVVVFIRVVVLVEIGFVVLCQLRDSVLICNGSGAKNVRYGRT